MIKKSLDEGCFPDIWKISSITIIFKSGDKVDVANYRPVSIMSHLDKLIESIVLSTIARPVNCILIDEQHGFRSGRSTPTCNAIFTEYILDVFRNHNQVDVIYSDF